jgi:hypothetical protein
METTVTFSINVIGEESGNPFTGTFKVKTLLSRREHFAADERRRMIVGANPTTILPKLDTDAFMIAQLSVRVVEAPSWWKQSDSGLDLDDSNVIAEVFSLAIKAEVERKESIKKAQLKP